MMCTGKLIMRSNTDETPSKTAGVTATNTTADAGNSNRLAPYNPTHATAQSNALDLLNLTSSDIFFDLGCGDGRLILAALERCYDDDYLLQVHQERFAKLQLLDNSNNDYDNHHNNVVPTKKQQAASPRRDIYRKTYNTDTATTPSNKIHHSRSYSTDYSVPHLMCTASDDQDDESESGCSSSGLFSNISRSSQKNNNNEKEEGKQDRRDSALTRDSISINENSTSATPQPGPPSLQPPSPITPLMNNRRFMKVFETPLTLASSQPRLPPFGYESSSRRKKQDLFTTTREQSKDVNLSRESTISDSIPTTITTPPDDEGGKGHNPQISELPTDVVDSLGIDQYNSIMPTGSGSGFLMTIPSADEIICSGSVYSTPPEQQHTKKDSTPPMITEAQASTNNNSKSKLGIGLQCVGIEYNQALAESAQENVSKSYLYPHVEKKVCIRWSDVLDEWTRSKGDANNDDECVGNCNSKSSVIWNESEQGSDDATNLTLLDDATAVFVYLLPQGLKKVKPLLYEAAVRRDRQRKYSQQQLLQQQQQHQEIEAKQQHPLHPLRQLQQHTLIEKESSGTSTAEETNDDDECPFPPTHLGVHRKGNSHLSDITDYDFGPTHGHDFRTLESIADEGESGEEVSPSQSLELNSGSNNGVVVVPPPFRVVSYMFSIPGWSPTKVDKSSKGSCPLYLYEKIHEEEK